MCPVRKSPDVRSLTVIQKPYGNEKPMSLLTSTKKGRGRGGAVHIYLLMSILLVLCYCAMGISEARARQMAQPRSLRATAAERGVWIGTTIQDAHWEDDQEYKTTLAREFNVGVAFLFMRLVQPRRNEFHFRVMDKLKAFAREHNMKLAGHALLYQDSTEPKWLGFDRADCGGWGRAELDAILKQHVQTVVAHGGEEFYVWDVVNEPLSRSGNLRRKCWQKILGEEHLAQAFRYAREANPRVLLRLNEAFGEQGVDPLKAEKFFALVRRMKANHVPIDVVGIQMHLEINGLRSTYASELRRFLLDAQAIGVGVHITEMDAHQGDEPMSAYQLERQKAVYKTVLKTCLAFPHCTSFTTWGLTDKYSWLRNRRKNVYPHAHPLLFDDRYLPKPAYFGLIEAIQESVTVQD